jgi:hypothetical protein
LDSCAAADLQVAPPAAIAIASMAAYAARTSTESRENLMFELSKKLVRCDQTDGLDYRLGVLPCVPWQIARAGVAA